MANNINNTDSGNTFIQLNNRYADPDQWLQIVSKLSDLTAEDFDKRVDLEKSMLRLRLTNEDIIFLKDKKQREAAFQESIRQQNALIDRAAEANLERIKKEKEAAFQAAIENGEELTKERIDEIEDEFNLRAKEEEELRKERKKKAKKDSEEELKKDIANIKSKAKAEVDARSKNLFSLNAEDRKNAWKDVGKGHKDKDGNDIKRNPLTVADDIVKGLANLAKQLNNQIDTIASKKSAIDTRLQGARLEKQFNGSYWDKISSDITEIAGVSPYIKQSAVVEKISSMVDQGIAFNLEQRAVIDTLKDKIATTFEATNATLLRLIRIQQQDTTAARLGMESSLTAFLNNMYETTEYMKGIADSVKGSLEEAMSLMSGENALSFEYQVQKWMGSLYSVGMNQTSAQNLAGVIGQIAAGQLQGLTSGGTSNLAIMAANRAGLSISEMMAKGLDESATNKLMEAMVEYLGDIYSETKGNNILQQQFASIFGMTASDLKAVANLSSSTKTVAKHGLNYSQALNRLYSMTGSIGKRTSMGEMMSTMKDNVMYSTAGGIAANPYLYGLNTMSNLLDTFVGGMPIPFVNTLLGGVDLHTTVADLMRVGAFSTSILESLGKMISGGTNMGFDTTGILNRIGVNNKNSTFVTRGTGAGLTTMKGLQYSSSGTTAANGSANDIVSKTMTDAADSQNSQLAEATDSQDEITIKDVNANVVQIYELLERVVNGTDSLHVVTDYNAVSTIGGRF